MKQIYFFLLLIIAVNSCKTSALSKYISIQNITKEDSYCNKRYSKEGKFLNGAYKINYGKGFTTYAIYKHGYYQEVMNSSRGFIWSKEKYDTAHYLIEYVAFMDRKNKNVDDYYQIHKYDSVKTFFQRNNITKSIFYANNKAYNVDYLVEQQKIKIKTNINNFKIINSLNIFSAIPSKFFFSNCYNNKFLYDVGKRNEKLYIEIILNNEIKYQNFQLNNYNEKEDSKIDFYDYEETIEIIRKK